MVPTYATKSRPGIASNLALKSTGPMMSRSFLPGLVPGIFLLPTSLWSAPRKTSTS